MTDPTTDPAAAVTDPLDVALTRIGELETQVADYKLLLADVQNSTRRLREDADLSKEFIFVSFSCFYIKNRR